MIYVQGCLGQALINGEVGAIGHQANCFNTMKSGVAATIRKYFMEAIQSDLLTIRGDRTKLGTFSVGHTPYGPVFNLYGQYNYGYNGKQYTDYHALGLALHGMRKRLEMWDIWSVGLPKLGCGLAGGEWEVVEPMIERIFEGYDVKIYVKE